MASNRSEFLSSLGTLFEIVKSLTDGVRGIVGDKVDQAFRNLLTDKKLRQQVVALISQSVQKVRELLTVSLNCALSLSEMIALGGYNWFNDEITTDRFPMVSGTTSAVEITFFQFDLPMSSEAVIAAMDAEGYKPMLIEHLLAIGAQHKERQRKNPIVALGSVGHDSNGARVVAYLVGWRGRRKLILSAFGGDWVSDYVFGAVRK